MKAFGCVAKQTNKGQIYIKEKNKNKNYIFKKIIKTTVRGQLVAVRTILSIWLTIIEKKVKKK